MKIIRKKNPIDIKQPQEIYCSNFECLSEIADLSPLYGLLSEHGVKYSKSYCLNCIVEGKINGSV